MGARRAAWLGATLSAAWLTLACPATASEPIAETLAAAARAEAEAEPARALELYRLAVFEHPGDRLLRRARARIDWLEARSEGGFVALRELTRAHARVEPSPQDLTAFEAKVPSFPPGLVRREAWHYLAETWLGRMNEPARALAAYEAWLREPDLDDADRQLAHAGLSLARARLGHTTEALDGLAHAGLDRRAEGRFLRAERIAKAGTIVSLSVLVGYAMLLARTFARARRTFRWSAVARRDEALVAGVTLGTPTALVGAYDPQLVHAFAPTMLAAGLVLAVTWFARAATTPNDFAARALRLASALAVFSASFLAAAEHGLVTELLMAAWEPR